VKNDDGREDEGGTRARNPSRGQIFTLLLV